MEIRKIIHIQLFILLSAAILYLGKPLLMPLAIAGMFALVFMPFCRWLQKKGCPTVAAAIICGLVFTLLVAGVILFIIWHVQHIATDFSDILVLFGGDLVWGIPGMILAIPALGIIKIVCDHIEPLQPVGHLLGENKPAGRWALFRLFHRAPR